MPKINSLFKKQRLYLSHEISIWVRKKRAEIETGSTPYYLSYSFKGDQENYPIIPRSLLYIAEKLNIKLDKHNQTLIALDRGGTALGVALSTISDLPLFITFSYPNSLKQGISWLEPGGGKYLGIPHLPKGSHVILVDDEINTGRTFVNAIDTLRNYSINVDQVLVVVEIDRKKNKGRKLIENRGCQLKSLYSIPEPIFNKTLGDYVFSL